VDEIVKENIYCNKLEKQVTRSHSIKFIKSGNRGIIAAHKSNFTCDHLCKCNIFDCDKINNKDKLIYSLN